MSAGDGRQCPAGNPSGGNTFDDDDDGIVISITADVTAGTTSINNDAPYHRGDACVVRTRSRYARACSADLSKEEEMQTYAAFLVARSTL